MSYAEANDVEEHNFITLAAALVVYVCVCLDMSGHFLPQNCHSLAEVSGLHFLLLAANFPP